MVLDYIPCDIDNFSYVYEDYKQLKKLDINEANELFWSLLDFRFCRHILKIGNNKGKLCMRKYKIFDCNDKFLCNKHRYQEKMKCNEKGCDKLVKNKKYCKKHNISRFKKCYYYNNHINEHSYLNIDIDILFTKNWKKTYYSTSSTPLFYGFCNKSLDLEEDISLYILKMSSDGKKRKNKLRFIFIYIYSKIIKKKKTKLKIDNNKNIDTFMSNFLIENTKKLEDCVNCMKYIIEKENNMNVAKPFLLNIIYTLTNIFKIKIKDYKDNKDVILYKNKVKDVKYTYYNNILIDIWWYYFNNISIYWKQYNINKLFKDIIYIPDINKKQIIVYNIHGFDITYKYFRLRIKKYTKNKKKNDRKKLRILYNNAKNDKSLDPTKDYFYEIKGDENTCYECNQNNNILKIYYLHYNIIYELYNCNNCSMSDGFIEAFGIKIIDNINEFIKNKKIIYKS